jgi:hypothetical protein
MDDSFTYRLRKAISDSYTMEDLEQMASDCLKLRLARVSGSGTLDHVVFELVEWASRQPRLADLPVHVAKFKTDRGSRVPVLDGLRAEFEAGNALTGINLLPQASSPTERALFDVVQNKRRSVLLALLREVTLSPLIPPDTDLLDELADIYTEQTSRRLLVIVAKEWLAESGSSEMALPPGYINADTPSLAWSKQLLVEAGKVGAPALAALCAVVMFEWPGATNARRVFARLCDDYGETSPLMAGTEP